MINQLETDQIWLPGTKKLWRQRKRTELGPGAASGAVLGAQDIQLQLLRPAGVGISTTQSGAITGEIPGGSKGG